MNEWKLEIIKECEKTWGIWQGYNKQQSKFWSITYQNSQRKGEKEN